MRVIFGSLVYFQNDCGLTDFATLQEFTRLQGEHDYKEQAALIVLDLLKVLK